MHTTDYTQVKKNHTKFNQMAPMAQKWKLKKWHNFPNLPQCKNEHEQKIEDSIQF